MRQKTELERLLSRIDGRGYKAYQDIAGAYELEEVQLFVDHVQGDPFASPSKFRLRLPRVATGIPGDWLNGEMRRVSLADFLVRRIKKGIQRMGATASGSGKSGRVFIDAGGQEVLERTAGVVNEAFVEIRVEAGLPAAGRRILGREALQLLANELPALTRNALMLSSEGLAEADFFWKTVENQEAIRRQLGEKGLVAFIADGAILPRETGVSDRPLSAHRCVGFESPASMRIGFELPHPITRDGGERSIAGMGIPRGVTLIAGGGYHGKSTLLRALERCVYPHIPGDGREYVVTDPDAVKIRAEDRRRIEKVDISPFINNLPNGQGTTAFSTDEASGSTSQAASIMEAIEAGGRVLLVDEDTSATNFMVRDARMQALVEKSREPITPFLERVRQIYEECGISTILVMGGSGDYFDAADHVIVMSSYRPEDATEKARRIARELPGVRRDPPSANFPSPARRRPTGYSVDPAYRGKHAKIEARSEGTLRFGEWEIDLRAVEQLVESSQTRAVGYALALAARRWMEDGTSVSEILDRLERLLDEEGLEMLDPYVRGAREERKHPGNFVRPRRHEVAAALNRLRSLRIEEVSAGEGKRKGEAM